MCNTRKYYCLNSSTSALSPQVIAGGHEQRSERHLEHQLPPHICSRADTMTVSGWQPSQSLTACTPARARGCQRQEQEEPNVSVFPPVLFHGGFPFPVCCFTTCAVWVCRDPRQPAALQIRWVQRFESLHAGKVEPKVGRPVSCTT